MQSRIWILSIGFSLAFGAMFIKTWRVYKLFTNKRFKVRVSTVLVIKLTHYKNSFWSRTDMCTFDISQPGPLYDWSMLAMVGAIILVDIAILLSWELADPLEHKAVKIDEMVGLHFCFVC